MRGSIKTQITTALKACTRIGLSRHEVKKLYGGKSVYIHSLGTFDKTAHRLWPLQAWLKGKGITDIELLTPELIADYLASRLAYHIGKGNSRKTYQVEISALGNLERGLSFFSQKNRTPAKVYDFTRVRKEAGTRAKILAKTTACYRNRALQKPLDLIEALSAPHHRLMALVQFYCGCRTEGVGAPRRKTSDGHFLKLDNFKNSAGQLLACEPDPITGRMAQPFWTKEKGGKIATKYCPLPLMNELMAWFQAHPEGLGDNYDAYLSAINKAMRKTGQYAKGKGTHALRFNFAQQRYLACVLPEDGMGDEEAKLQVSHELSHNRPDITESYLR